MTRHSHVATVRQQQHRTALWSCDRPWWRVWLFLVVLVGCGGGVEDEVVIRAVVDVATVTRVWGGAGGQEYVAHRASLVRGLDDPGPATVRIGNFPSAGAAQAAVQATVPGLAIRWRRADLEGGVVSYVGAIPIVGSPQRLVRYGVVGDSIAYGYPDGSHPFTAQLGELLVNENVSINNIAVSGANVLSVFNAQVPELVGLTDGDMTDPSTFCWPSVPNKVGTVSKEADSPSWLKIEHLADNNPAVYQRLFVPGQSYTLRGYARSDGSRWPQITASGLGVLWTGTQSTERQPFEISVTAHTENVYFGSIMSASGYVGYDSIELEGGPTPPDIALVLVGINDIAGGKSVAYTTGYLADIYRWLRIAGCEVVGIQLTPWAAFVGATPTRVQNSLDVNAWMPTSSYLDRAIDTSSMGDPDFVLHPTYDYGDGVHLSDSGSNRLGTLVYEQMR